MKERRTPLTIALIITMATGCAPPAGFEVPPPTAEETPLPKPWYCERRGWHEWSLGETRVLAPNLNATLTSLSEEEAEFTIYQTQGDPVQERVRRDELKFLGPYVVIFPSEETAEEPIICFLTTEEWQQQNTPPPLDQT